MPEVPPARARIMPSLRPSMKAVLAPLLLLSLLVFAGCAATTPGDAATDLTDSTVTVKGASGVRWQVRPAYVFVDGRRKGITPATYRIRRSFGTTEIKLFTSLRKGSVPARTFEVELAPTESRTRQDFSFNLSNAEGLPTLDVATLSRRKDGTVVIPYYRSPLQIKDRDFGLTLIVQE